MWLENGAPPKDPNNNNFISENKEIWKIKKEKKKETEKTVERLIKIRIERHRERLLWH